MMEKVIIVSSTNRPNSNTLKVSRIYERILADRGIKTGLLDFKILPENITTSESFGKRTEAYSALLNEYVLGDKRFIFVIPEYNGSFPGILKTFMDSMHPREWANKKACLVGVSDGRAGNLRGMEHFTGVLHYLKMHVFYNKLPISSVAKVMDAGGNFNEEQLNACKQQLEGFLNF